MTETVATLQAGLKKSFRGAVDWILVGAMLPILGAGLLTMNSFSGQSAFFTRQLVLISVSLVWFFILSFIDFRFLKRTWVVVALYASVCGLLVLLFGLGTISKGAQSWFRLGLFSVEPSDPAQIVLLLVLAKYFSRRHVEIAHFKHIFISGFYTLILFLLILVQPDFGVAVIIFSIWLGMVLVAGISKKHLFLVFAIGAVSFASLWFFVFHDYQKSRIKSFVNPVADLHGAGYNAYQSMVAVGSGELWGKGIGYGTQSKLNFLPEYQTDFIFAAFAEEWGYIGTMMLLGLYGIIIWRVLANAMHGASNFEILYGSGVAIYLMAHLIINIGMNIGLLVGVSTIY
jgi:rod shape determining protein RodA